ncbi:MAG: ribosomal L7Ae/L30e/S12e/Gadd45 family protein, partial [Nanoarchaeota archaeon]|nr:ribosomal L7Ae/L30e/S12e/Gadd45 family protein [Nanoarchaeota archaeon]
LRKTIQEKIKQNKVIIGKKETIKAAKEGTIEFIVYADNADEKTVKALDSLEVKKYKYEGDSEALSILCGKPFNVLVLGVEK